MVRSDLAPSRADSLALVGGELALDFANTSSGRGWPSLQEHLQRPEDLARWAGHAKLLGPSDAAWLAESASEPSLGAPLLAAALALREDVYRLATAIAAGLPPPEAHLARLSQTHAHALSRGALTPIAGRFGWTWSARATPIEAVLGPITLSALTLLQQADLTRVKQCPGENCGWLFFDATKNKSRRWCEMEVCGNRAKQKRFARAKAT